MEGIRNLNIDKEIYQQCIALYDADKIKVEELFFLLGFDICKDGTPFYKDEPTIKLALEVLDNTVRYNPIFFGRHFIFAIHRLQALKKWKAAIYKKGVEVIHIDNDMMNNHIDNLKLGTHSERMMKRTPEQRKNSASHAASFKRVYDPEEVITFHNSVGGSWKKTMAEFGMSKSTLSAILKNKDGLNHNIESKLDILKGYVDVLSKYGGDGILVTNYFILLHNLLIIETLFRKEIVSDNLQLCKHLKLKKETKSDKIITLCSKLISDKKIAENLSGIQNLDVVKKYIESNPIVYAKLQEYVK